MVRIPGFHTMAHVRSLVGELRSHKPRCTAKKKKKRKKHIMRSIPTAESNREARTAEGGEGGVRISPGTSEVLGLPLNFC